MSISLKRAIEAGDHKYVKLCEVYIFFENGNITKEEAVNLLGESYRNTVTMWSLTGNATDQP